MDRSRRTRRKRKKRTRKTNQQPMGGLRTSHRPTNEARGGRRSVRRARVAWTPAASAADAHSTAAGRQVVGC